MTDLGVQIDREALETLCSDFDLSLVLLHGSRATGHHRPESDTDIGVLQTKEVIPWRKLLDVQQRLAEIVQPGNIDLVDLRAVPGLLRHLASERGVVLYERAPGVFAHFRLLAWNMYQDERIQIRRHDSRAIQIALEQITA